MKKKIFKLLGIVGGEVTPVFLLLGIGFCIGIFLATIAVAATSLFLNSYSETEDLPVALVISGAFAVLFTGAYSFLQGKISFNALTIGTLLLFITLTSLVEFGNHFIANENLLYYFAFTLILPFTFVSRLIFWGTFNRLFDIHQTRRIISTIDIGMDMASVIAFFAIPVILGFGVELTSIFSISLVSITALLALYIILSVSYMKQDYATAAGIQKLSVREFFKSRYIIAMSLFIVLSTVASRFVDYTFLNVTSTQFTPKDLPYFLSYFEATIITFSFLFTVLVTDRINHEYGTRVSLIINPILMLFSMSIALGLGSTLGYNSELSKTAYFFFIMVAMGKLFIESMREAIDEPTLKFYYIPFDRSVKNDVQTKVEGVVMGASSLLAGIMIVLINRFQVFDLLSIVLFVIAVAVVWYWVINYMHKNYLVALRSSLEKNKSDMSGKYVKEHTLHGVLEERIHDTAEKKVIYSLKLMEKLDPSLFEKSIVKLSKSPLNAVRRYAKSRLGESETKASAYNDSKTLALEAAGEMENGELLSVSPEKLIALGKSIKQSDRIFAAKLLRKVVDDKTIFTLLELLRDQDPKVREAAIETARKVKRPETWNILIEMLGSMRHANQAASALKEAGRPVLDYLNTAFYKTGQSDLIMQRIIRVIGAVGGAEGLALMWQKLEYPDTKIVNQILHSLGDKQYDVTGKRATLIKGLLNTEIGKMLWNLVALEEVPEQEDFVFLKTALEEEVEDNYDQIILMLSLLYDRKSIQLVKENIDSGSSDGRAYAVELLNLFVDPDLKATLIPLLESSPTSDKLEKLQLYFPRESYAIEALINNVLNRSFSYNNRWTKLCAVHAIAFLPNFKVTESLVAQIFNRDKILQETAAWVIYHRDRPAYETIVRRIPQQDKNFLYTSIKKNQLVGGLDDGYFLKIEIVMAIRELPIFKGIKGNLLCEIAEEIEQIEMKKDEKTIFNTAEDEGVMLMVAFGAIALETIDGEKIFLKKGKLFGNIFQYESTSRVARITAREYSVVFSIGLSDFYFILANHHELTHRLIQNESEIANQNESA